MKHESGSVMVWECFAAAGSGHLTIKKKNSKTEISQDISQRLAEIEKMEHPG